MNNQSELWDRYRQYLCRAGNIDLALDISRMNFDPGFLERMEPAIQTAYRAMDDLEDGAIANPDENRMVGHYWLRPQARAFRRYRSGDREYAGGHPSLRRRRAFRRDQAGVEARIYRVAQRRYRGFRAGADVRLRRAGRPHGRPDGRALHRQHRPRRHRPPAFKHRGPPGRDALPDHQ